MARGGSRSSSPARSSSSSSRSYGTSTATRSSPAPAPARAPAPAPAAPAHAPTHATHPPTQQHHAPQQPMMGQQQQSGGGGLLSGLAGTMMSGMAFGAGSSVAHRAVDAVMGPREVNHVHSNSPAAAAAAPNNCAEQNNKFTQCMKENQGSIASCQYLYDVLSQCQREAQQQQ